MSDDLKTFIADKFEEHGRELGAIREAVENLEAKLDGCQWEMRPRVEELEKARDSLEITARNAKWLALAILGTGGIGGILKELWERLH